MRSRGALAGGVFAALLAAAPAQACAPAGLVRVVFRNISPGLAAADPAAQPRTLFRQGTRFLRTEEDPDPNRGQPVIIVAEPDVWVINLATRTGQHALDTEADQTVHAPVIPATDAPPLFRTLEYGCEPEFVATHAPAPRNTTQFGATPATLHVVEGGEGHALAILMDPRRKAPLLISYIREGRPVLVVRYDDWRNDLPMREGLFAPPKNVKLQEAPRNAGAPR
jgi:hypothetical protein